MLIVKNGHENCRNRSHTKLATLKTPHLALSLFALGISLAPAVTLFQDSFDIADTTNFDAPSTAGRLAGDLASDVLARATRAQQHISSNSLLLRNSATGSGGVCFENAAGTFGAANRFNWAGGTSGTSILADGGFIVPLDWAATATTT